MSDSRPPLQLHKPTQRFDKPRHFNKPREERPAPVVKAEDSHVVLLKEAMAKGASVCIFTRESERGLYEGKLVSVDPYAVTLDMAKGATVIFKHAIESIRILK